MSNDTRGGMQKKNAFRSMKDYLRKGSMSHVDLILTGLLGALLLFCWLFRMPLSEALTNKLEISYGYSAKQDEKGLFYVVDDGHNRLISFDSEEKVVSDLISPQNGEGGSLYIDNFAVDGGLVYLSASEWNGMLLDREVIVVFEGSDCIRTIAERDYSGMTVNKHRFYGISVRDGVLSYAECEENAIVLHHFVLADGTEKTDRIYYDNAFNAVSDCAFDGETVYIMDKKGSITAIRGEERTSIYSTTWEGEEDRIPFRLDVSRDGVIVFTDIRKGQIIRLVPHTQDALVIAENSSSQTVNFTYDGKGILYLEEDGVHVEFEDGSSVHQMLSKSALQCVIQAVWILAGILFFLFSAVLLLRLLVSTINRKFTTIKKVSFAIIGVVALVSFIICGMMMRNFSTIYRQRLMNQIESSATILAKQIPEEAVTKINRAEDFDSTAYRSICDLMEQVFSYDFDFNRQLYCNVLRLSEDGKSAFAVAYLDQSIGVYFPVDESEVPEVVKAYKIENGGQVVWNNSVSDVSGTYLSVKVPVVANGKVCGVVSVGSETYVIQDMITNLQMQIFLSVAVILMLIWLAISEGIAWFANKAKYQEGLKAGRRDALPGHLIRLLVFAVFACFNIPATFLPVWILRNSNIFSESSRDFMASLPITVNIFVIGIMSLFTASGVRRLGMGRILTISTVCSLSGNLLMFLIPSYYSVCAGLLVDGIGVGLITNAMYVLLTYIHDEKDQQWGFTVYNTAYLAGMNFGMLLGSLLAVLLGQRTVFVIVALVWLVMMLMGNLLLRQLQEIMDSESAEQAADSGGRGISRARFLLNKPVMSFIVLIQNPYIVFNSFVFYFVPLFCGEMGYDETIVSMLIMLYSEIAVLTGDLMTQRMTRLLGNKAMYLAYVTNIAALMVFAFTCNMLGVVLALLLMGSAAAYGKPLQQTWFLKLKQVRQYGEDRAMGVYNFSENIGESLGPIVFARLMAQRPLAGAVSSFCGAMLVFGGGHFLLNHKERKE